jgi:BMFP domain-containing protein YqiC
MFNDLVNQVNASFERLERRIEELEAAKKPSIKPAEKKKSTSS